MISYGKTSDDAKEEIFQCLFRFIDRMNDVCEQDTADRIIADFTAAVDPIIQEYLELSSPREHMMRQMWLEFRSPEEIEAAEQERAARRRRRRG